MASAPSRLVNRLGLHARAAARLVALASEYNCSIEIRCNGAEADAKSIMAVMMLAAACGTELMLVCDGDDEEPALAALLELIEDRFGEEE
jgi:phosphocarrier protein HPr